VKIISQRKKIKQMKKVILVSFVVLLGFMMSSCKKDTTTPVKSHTPYAIRMTDAPGPYSAVYIDVVGVEITGSNGQVVSMNVNAGIYNLLNFSNGIDTLIATAVLETATVEQIRLILGSNNSVVVDGVSYPLSTPSADQSGLKIQVHQILQADVQYNVLIDFDANKSIIETGNGVYKLKPVIRAIDVASSGIIQGNITPVGTVAFVTSISDQTFSTNVNTSGKFKIVGLPVGTYSVIVTPVTPFAPVTVTNITVTAGVTTDIGLVTL
jgi:hypothetical protein